MVPKSDHLANPRFDKKPSVQVPGRRGRDPAEEVFKAVRARVFSSFQRALRVRGGGASELPVQALALRDLRIRVVAVQD